VGSLAGALKHMGEDEEEGRGPAHEADPHPAGVLVAVLIDEGTEPLHVIDILTHEGAREVDKAEGTWRDGMWTDFDPTAHKVSSREHSRPVA
jgi:hypothetical protein